MTRIVAGSARGRTLAVPAAGTRPTTDRVREAVFSALEARGQVADARVLDLYAGSGALGLEAASRGAQSVLLVESDRRAAAICRRNADTLGLSGVVSVRAARVEQLLRRPAPHAFDLVLCDPPYDLESDRLDGVLGSLADGGWLAPGAVVLVERSARDDAPGWPAPLEPDWKRTYGETAVHVATTPAR
ncbi:methyltransferase [Beutenbergia cavernae DSM 12333]|uniref:Methyltransferase n=1 Tax=Beutenbergia cavernae (strain ATCC BAA-8 / DSM 12333 / CCUG 43141 / JCM 11478 / NBRC 16432 / NCIMB 13614 / HKI 0122) TaxID=471853 RepID=C5C3G1_BEUC1|nr:16S rRNA (guanine(966)-N(2))-methyltransferase RsmD [Beutenbergia cavernae]ACQ79860.1 methyltransferase [Beutenbergia cavernae DSM 12333]